MVDQNDHELELRSKKNNQKKHQILQKQDKSFGEEL